MSRLTGYALLAGLAVAGCVWAQQPADTSQTAIEAAVARVRPALVRIHVVSAEYDQGREVKVDASGSGVVISKEGHVVTNHHVAGHAARLFCTFSDREELEAELIGADPLTDLAVIKIKSDGKREFPVAPFGDSSKLEVGEPVLAMGSPMALSQSVTRGIVSNVEMIMPEWIRDFGFLEQDGEDIGVLVKWIGHDAKIAGGNSGGPLVNFQGEIVGINEISMGLGGAIPGNLVRSVAEQLIAGGKVVRAWMGFSVQPRLKHGIEKKGILVGGVLNGSPAEAAGLRSGDLIVKLNGAEVDARYAEEVPDFNRAVAALAVGKEAELTVWRDGAETGVKVTPVEREKVKLKEQEIKPWGITASNISLMAAKEMKRATRDGVLVTSVRPGGGAGDAKPALEDRDVIVEVNGQPVRSLSEFRDITEQIVKGKTELVPVLTAFDRKTERCLTVVKVGIKDLEDPGLEVKKAWLPCETQPITRPVAEALGKPDLTGFRVTQVFANTAAEKAGLKTGDLILVVDTEKLTASAPEHYEELAALIRQYRVGDTVQLHVLRGQEEVTVPVELARWPQLAREMKQYRDEQFELTARDICFFDRAKEQWKEDQQGVLVKEVTSGGWAALGHLREGDLILKAAGAPIAGVEAFRNKMQEIAASRPRSVVFEVLRGIQTLYVELEPNWDDKSAG